jgi:hypothetical protein
MHTHTVSCGHAAQQHPADSCTHVCACVCCGAARARTLSRIMGKIFCTNASSCCLKSSAGYLASTCLKPPARWEDTRTRTRARARARHHLGHHSLRRARTARGGSRHATRVREEVSPSTQSTQLIALCSGPSPSTAHPRRLRESTPRPPRRRRPPPPRWAAPRRCGCRTWRRRPSAWRRIRPSRRPRCRACGSVGGRV